MSSYPEFDRIDEVVEGLGAEQEDVFTRPTKVSGVVDVGFVGSDEDMTTRKAQEPIASAAFSEVQGHRSVSFGSSPDRDAEPQGRSQGTNDVDGWV